MQDYETLSQATAGLKERGYVEDYSLKGNSLECTSDHTRVAPQEFDIEEFYRFEGVSNPSDMSIVFAIKDKKHDRKGVLVAGFGSTADELDEKLLQALDMR